LSRTRPVPAARLARRANLLDKDTAGNAEGRFQLDDAILDPGELTLRVLYSSINYKDALAAIGAGKIIRRFLCGAH